jgi:hypothetical protein
MVLVIAPSYRDYKRFLVDHNIYDNLSYIWRYIDCPNKLRGINKFTPYIIVEGEYTFDHNMHEISRLIEDRRCVRIQIKETHDG